MRAKTRRAANTGLTLRLFEVGSRVSTALNLLTAAKPMLDELAADCQEVVHLVERDNSDVIYIYKAEPARPLVRMASYVGCRNPMYCTGVGKSILAYLPDEEVIKVWDSSEIHTYTEKTITDLDTLRSSLERVRRLGYAVDDEEHEPGVRCVAAPIFNWSDHPVAAVSISAPGFPNDRLSYGAVAAQTAPVDPRYQPYDGLYSSIKRFPGRNFSSQVFLFFSK